MRKFDLTQTVNIYPSTDENILYDAISYVFDIDKEYLLYLEKQRYVDNSHEDYDLRFFESILHTRDLLHCYNVTCKLVDLFCSGDFISGLCDWLFLMDLDDNPLRTSYLLRIKSRYGNTENFATSVGERIIGVDYAKVGILIRLHLNMLDEWLDNIKLGG